MCFSRHRDGKVPHPLKFPQGNRVKSPTRRASGSDSFPQACRRRSKSEPPCRLNIEPGVEADVSRVGCG
ncbi:hypothetical protein CBP34_07955 [Acidovorax carolinensis]|uniref:Uncharacterized protein n=1 Tax=Acidovorax carolinensis TaxID=553814 RepID=A0A240U2J2_9BURK|nr:hypothetical protein CBP34_07955 [Acidovorax carolinensis]